MPRYARRSRTPYRRRATRKPRARKTPRRRYGKGPGNKYKGRLNRMLTGFPQDNRARLLWTVENSLDLSVGTNEEYAIRANSIYDPEGSTAPTNYPMQYAAWQRLYNHYMVVSATITVKFMIPASATPSAKAVCCFLRLNDDGLAQAPFDYANICSGALTRYKTVMQGTTPQTVLLRGTYAAKSFFQVRDVSDNQTRLGAPFGSDPQEEAYWITGAFVLGGAENAGYDIQQYVSVHYNTYFTEPKDQQVTS